VSSPSIAKDTRKAALDESVRARHVDVHADTHRVINALLQPCYTGDAL